MQSPTVPPSSPAGSDPALTERFRGRSIGCFGILVALSIATLLILTGLLEVGRSMLAEVGLSADPAADGNLLPAVLLMLVRIGLFATILYGLVTRMPWAGGASVGYLDAALITSACNVLLALLTGPTIYIPLDALVVIFVLLARPKPMPAHWRTPAFIAAGIGLALYVVGFYL